MKIISAQLNYTIGDFEQNTRKILDVISKEGEKADLIIFSELCLSGYYPLDLIDRPDFIEAQNKSLNVILERSKIVSATIMIGAIDDNLGPGKPHFNALFVIQSGKIIFKYHKKLLPVYNIFNEARHFEPGRQPGIFSLYNKRIGLLICEDGWGGENKARYQLDPVCDLEDEQLDLVVSINGSPSNLGKALERQVHFSSIAKRCKAPVVFVNQVGGNDDIVFDGGSFILDAEGRCVGQLPFFKEATGLSDLGRTLLPGNGFTPSQTLTLPEFCYQQIILGLRDYAEKCHVSGIVIGVSGGIDSALTLALAVDALGQERVHAIFMPSEFTAQQSQEDALAVTRNLGVTCHIHSIQTEFELAKTNFRNVFQQEPSDLTSQNIQARLRGRILMAYSNQTGFLLISTGNKSELSVGFTTLYGDLAGGFNIIGDLYKTEVYEVAKFYNKLHTRTVIPTSILERAPTPELAPNQTDQDSLPPYDQLDSVLKLFIEGDLLPESERTICQAIQDKLSKELIQSLHLKVDRAEFKRRQACPILRLQRRAFGGGRQFPIARGY